MSAQRLLSLSCSAMPRTERGALDRAAALGTMQAMKHLLLLSLLVLAGCVTSTPATIVRFEGHALRACTVMLGWSEEDLRGQCGEPIGVAPRAGGTETCLLYSSVAHALGAASHVAPFFAVCLEPTRMRRTRSMVATSVYGLRSIPSTLTSSATR